MGISENELGTRAKLMAFKWLINCKQLFYVKLLFMHPHVHVWVHGWTCVCVCCIHELWSQLSVVSGRSHEYPYLWAVLPGTEVGVGISESTVDFIIHIACGGGEGGRSRHSCLEIDMFCPTQKGCPCME